jgi:hypothetical protein
MKNEFLTKVESVPSQPVEPNLSKTKLLQETADITESFLVVLFSGLMFLAVLIYFLKGLSRKQQGGSAPLRSPRIPCPNCYFFSDTVHLRCAVNPKLTMTTEASSCCDYKPRRPL